MVDKLQKSEGEYKGWTKVINNMRAVINTLVPSLEEEVTKIEDLRRQMVVMEEENKKLFNEKEKNISRKIYKKLLQ